MTPVNTTFGLVHYWFSGLIKSALCSWVVCCKQIGRQSATRALHFGNCQLPQRAKHAHHEVLTPARYICSADISRCSMGLPTALFYLSTWDDES